MSTHPPTAAQGRTSREVAEGPIGETTITLSALASNVAGTLGKGRYRRHGADHRMSRTLARSLAKQVHTLANQFIIISLGFTTLNKRSTHRRLAA